MVFSFKALRCAWRTLCIWCFWLIAPTLTSSWFWRLLSLGFWSPDLTVGLQPTSFWNNPDFSKGRFKFQISALDSVLMSSDWALPCFTLDLSHLIINLLVFCSFWFRSLPGPPQMLKSGHASRWLNGRRTRVQLLAAPSSVTVHHPPARTNAYCFFFSVLIM